MKHRAANGLLGLFTATTLGLAAATASEFPVVPMLPTPANPDEEDRCRRFRTPRGWDAQGQSEASARDLGERKVRLDYPEEGSGLEPGHQYHFRNIKRVLSVFTIPAARTSCSGTATSMHSPAWDWSASSPRT